MFALRVTAASQSAGRPGKGWTAFFSEVTTSEVRGQSVRRSPAIEIAWAIVVAVAAIAAVVAAVLEGAAYLVHLLS